MNKCKVAYLCLFQLFDISVSTILYSQYNKWHDAFITQVRFFDINTSLFELWVFSSVRTIFFYGGILGFICSKRKKKAIKRINYMKLVVLFLCTFMWAYTLVKLLMYTEAERSTEDIPWFWSLVSWSIVASITFYINWTILGELKAVQAKGKPVIKTCNVNSIYEGEERLIEGSTDSDDDENNTFQKDKKSGEEKKESEEEELKTTEEKAATVWKLLSLSRPDLPYIFIAFFFMVVCCATETFTPYFTGEVIQGIAIDRDKHKFTVAIIYMALFAAASAVASGMRAWFFKIAMSRLDIRIRNQLFASIVQQEVGFFDTVKTGDISSRLQSDTAIMSSTLGLNTNVFVRSVLKTIGVVIFMVKLSWHLSMITLIGLPIITGFSKIYGDFYEKLSEKVQTAFAKANEVAEETCSSMRTVRSFASEEIETKRYKDKMAEVYGLNLREAAAYAGYMWGNSLFSLSLTIATLYYGGYLVIDNKLSGGNLVAFILYQEELGNSLENIGYVYTGLMQAVGASHKVFTYIFRTPKVINSGKLQPDKLHGKLEFKNVSFAYPSRPETTVLKNVSFSVEPGEVVALVGPSGGGKSSCVNLLEHFYETKSGNVLLDGLPIEEYDHKYLHEKIALVGQEPVLFARKISENIAYGLDGWKMEMVEEAAKMANAHQFISEMKDKYKTEAGEKGMQLSGGQKQRIAIARAIVRNPSVLLLDEATSALDSESEHVVQEAMYKNLKDRTVIIIAHRLSTVERATRIIVINKGEVIEQGTHRDLLKAGGMYSKLVKRQLLGFDSSSTDNKETDNSCNKTASDKSGPGDQQLTNKCTSCGKLGVTSSHKHCIDCDKAGRYTIKNGDGVSIGSFHSLSASPEVINSKMITPHGSPR